MLFLVQVYRTSYMVMHGVMYPYIVFVSDVWHFCFVLIAINVS